MSSGRVSRTTLGAMPNRRNETNSACTLYRSKITAASRSFPAFLFWFCCQTCESEKGCCMLADARVQVGDSGQETTLTGTTGRSPERRITQWLIAVTSGLLVGCVMMLYMTSCLHCSLPLSVIMSLVSAILTVIVCGLCRAVRCCAAISLPSLTTTSSGRLAVLVIITTLVVSGPLFNVCLNLRTMSTSLACGVELGRNQTALMVSSMDTLSSRLTTAVSGLQRSIRAAWRDLRPLDEGLMRLNGALYNGVIQLYGAHKVTVFHRRRRRGQRARAACPPPP